MSVVEVVPSDHATAASRANALPRHERVLVYLLVQFRIRHDVLDPNIHK